MKILVTGATGAAGPRVVGALCEGGYSVRTFSIDDPPSGAWPSGVEVLKGDITDTEMVVSAMNGIDGVIHMAVLLHIVSYSND